MEATAAAMPESYALLGGLRRLLVKTLLAGRQLIVLQLVGCR